jgi:ABC-2 type transport system permease protein
MNRLIGAEALKLRSTRTFTLLTLGALLLVAIVATASAAASSFHAGDHPGRESLSPAGAAQTFALILGVLALTSEFRHGTITPALLITPRRARLLAAKAIILALAGLGLGLLAFGGAAAIALPLLSHRGIASDVGSGDLVGIIAGGTATTALFAALGVGIGALVRNQVGAIIAALSLIYAVEPALTFLPGVGDAVQTYGLGGLSTGASGTAAFQASAHILGQGPAVLVLAVYAAAFLTAGAALLHRRDITA